MKGHLYEQIYIVTHDLEIGQNAAGSLLPCPLPVLKDLYLE